MFPSKSLRFRLALTFSAFGALLSILLSVGLYFAVQQVGHNLMDEALRAELEDTVERKANDRIFIPPNTKSIKGYFMFGEESGHFAPPSEFRKLQPGSYNATVGDIDYRMLVADRNGYRYFMMFDTDRQHDLEAGYIQTLFWFAVFIILVSIGVGLWLAVSIIAPVTRLAHQVSQADPSGLKLSLDKLSREDEVGDLARAFMRYMSRVREFVAREKFFTADVSHELRTPLTIISGAVEVLEQDGALSEKQKERLNRIKYAARDMRGLTEGLMLMSREYQPGVESVSCNVSKIVQGSVDKHLHLIENRPVRVQFELIDQPYLNVERPLLEIVIGNLLRNAFFNTTTGVVTLRLEADRLVLTDTGSGMSPEVLARVFERYFKGATSAGAGVGLSLVNRICDRYGWRISIDSQQGKGTTVEVYFGEGAKAFH